MLLPTDVLRAAQVRAASTTFLRLRPLVVLAGLLAQVWILKDAPVPASQRVMIVAMLGTALVAFGIESFALRRRQVSTRWLVTSLALTLVGLALASSATGGLGSPMLTLMLAPVVVALSALNRRALPMLVLFSGLVVVLGLVPPLGPPLPASVLGAAHTVALLTTLALLGLGVLGLGEAHARVASALDDMRRGVIEEAADRAREAEALGARVAHELKNPLAAISALVTLARRASEGREQERLDVVLGEVKRMEETLRDYLTLARPLTDVSLAAHALPSILDDVAAVVAGRAELAGVEIVVACPPLEVVADARRLREALVNLVINALEALEGPGTVRIEGRAMGDGVEIAVVDEGPGMSETTKARAGELFFTDKKGGTGLGLVMARSVARMHGGDLLFEHPPRGLRAVLRLGSHTEVLSRTVG